MKKVICLVSSCIAIIYSVIYSSLGGFSGNSGALSKIGLEHPLLFAVWGLLTYFALAFNIIVGYKKTRYRFYIPLLAVSLIGMILTICFDFDYDKYNEYILHCAGSLAFSAIMGITVFLLFLLRKSYVLATISGVILITDLVLLIIFKETAFIELMPIFAGYVMLCIHNLKKEKTLVEIN
ncbi:MAG: hypothetical protein J1E36_03465 [Eubacterium sp.]|nr:hypothetical protein [Eubacterium sp.]